MTTDRELAEEMGRCGYYVDPDGTTHRIIPAELAEQIIAALRRSQPEGEMVCPDCGSRHLRVIYECFNEKCDWRGSLPAAHALGSNGDAIGLCLDADSLNLSKEAFDASVDAALARHTPK